MTGQHLTDKIPEVIHGSSQWTESEHAHLTACESCRSEWGLVAGIDGEFSYGHLDGLADSILSELCSPKAIVIPRPVRRRWLSLGLAAAAVVALALTTMRSSTAPDGSGDSTLVPVLLPELGQLQDAELERLLASVQVPDEQYDSGQIPYLGDLTEAELEDLLNRMKG